MKTTRQILSDKGIYIEGDNDKDCEPLFDAMDEYVDQYKLLIRKYMDMIRGIEGTDYTEFNIDSDNWGNEKSYEINKEEAIELMNLAAEEL